MATTQPDLAAARGLVAVRATLLNADGTRNCGLTNGTAYSLCPQTITPSTQTEAGETETIQCGSGTTFATVTTDDTVTGIDLELVLVTADYELLWLMTGGETLTDGAGNVIGIGQRASSVAAPVFELSAWVERRAGAAIDGTYPYEQWHWGNCTATLGDTPLGTGFGTTTVSVKARGVDGAAIGNGSFLDLPVELYEGDSDGAFYGRFAVDSRPTDDTAPYNNGLGGGFINTPACAS